MQWWVPIGHCKRVPAKVALACHFFFFLPSAVTHSTVAFNSVSIPFSFPDQSKGGIRSDSQMPVVESGSTTGTDLYTLAQNSPAQPVQRTV